MATTGYSQQQKSLLYGHDPNFSNASDECKSSMPNTSDLQDFQSTQRTKQPSLPGFSIAVDPTALSTYEDPFNMMELDPDQFSQYENINFSAEELDAWISSQSMPGIISTVSPEPAPQERS